MKQVFFITDDRMSATLWQGTELIAKYEFTQDDESLSLFRDYLEESRNIETYIIVDVLEEEVTLTTIPHVAPHERKFLIDRAKTRLFRSATFCSANIIGRENNSRRDDRLLVTGLTSDRLLLRWLDIINEKNVLLRGVYSLPQMSGNVLKLLGKSKGLTFLVSRQSRDFIRQSIFKDGKLFYSRNIPSSQNFDIQTITDDLEKTKKYLQNQKLLNVDDRINVVVLASDRFYQQLSGLDELLPDMDLVYVKHDSLKSSLGIKSEFVIAGREIFSMLLMKSAPKNHYGREEDLSQYNKKNRTEKYNYLSIAVAIVFAMMSVKLYLDANVLDQNLKGLDDQIKTLKQQNNKLEKSIDRLPVKAKKMKVFVENMEDIDTAHKKGIESSLVTISQVFNAYSTITLHHVNWSINELVTKNGRVKGSRKQRNRKTKNKSDSKGQQLEITAAIDLSSLGHRQVMSVIDRFVASLSRVKSVKSVVVNKKPVNALSTDKVTGEISDKKKSTAEFALTLTIEDESHAG